jgi:hypothetical protein
MSSAVINLQKAIVGGQQSLTQLLRQTKLIASKLNLEDIEKWVDLELKGYPDDVEPPDYRTFAGGDVQIHNPMRGWLFAGQLNQQGKAHEPISQIEDFSKEETILISLNKNLPVQSRLPMAADWPQRITIAGTEFKRIVEGVKDELLRWTTELEKRGIKGEGMDFNEQEKQSATHNTFNIQKFTGILGNVTNSQVTLYDYGSINQLLVDQQIPKPDRRELEDIMDELKTAPEEKKASLLKRAENWIVEHKELLGTAAEAVGKAIGAATK